MRWRARHEEAKIRDIQLLKEASGSSIARGNGARQLRVRNGQAKNQHALLELRCDTTVVAPASRRMQASGARRAVRGAGWALSLIHI